MKRSKVYFNLAPVGQYLVLQIVICQDNYNTKSNKLYHLLFICKYSSKQRFCLYISVATSTPTYL